MCEGSGRSVTVIRIGSAPALCVVCGGTFNRNHAPPAAEQLRVTTDEADASTTTPAKTTEPGATVEFAARHQRAGTVRGAIELR